MRRPSRVSGAARLGALGRRMAAGGIGLMLFAIAWSASATPLPLTVRGTAYGNPGNSLPTPINVTTTDAPAFVPRTLSAVAGTSVEFFVTNPGNFTHTFSLSRIANQSLNPAWSPSQLDSYFAQNGSSVNLSVAPGASANVTFAVPMDWASGSFEFVSLVPYQFQAGMSGFFNVTSGTPSAGFRIQDAAAGVGLAFVPSAIQVNATSFPVTIEIDVSNLGTIAHTWTLDAQPGQNLTPSGFTAYFQSHAPAANVIVPTTANLVASANFTLTQKGVYEFICTVPGHFAAGMYGYLYVGVVAPSPSAPPSSALVEQWVLWVAAGLLGIGVVLAAAASLVGRFAPSAERPRHH